MYTASPLCPCICCNQTVTPVKLNYRQEYPSMLRAAANYIRGGWMQGGYFDAPIMEAVRMCASGAIMRVIADKIRPPSPQPVSAWFIPGNPHRELFIDLANLCASIIGTRVHLWNDQPSTTQSQVVTMFLQTAELCETHLAMTRPASQAQLTAGLQPEPDQELVCA